VSRRPIATAQTGKIEIRILSPSTGLLALIGEARFLRVSGSTSASSRIAATKGAAIALSARWRVRKSVTARPAWRTSASLACPDRNPHPARDQTAELRFSLAPAARAPSRAILDPAPSTIDAHGGQWSAAARSSSTSVRAVVRADIFASCSNPLPFATCYRRACALQSRRLWPFRSGRRLRSDRRPSRRRCSQVDQWTFCGRVRAGNCTASHLR
jgi:hypothetical protein